LFLRYYTKFDAPYDVTASSHNGSMISAHYYDGHNATPGVPADGTNKWLVNLENWRADDTTVSPGLTNVYVYHPEQRDIWGDHFFPTGLVMPNTSLPYDFGPDFVARDEFIPELQRWYCWEFMVVANTPGERDGRIAAWIDGVLIADWQNIRLRDVPELTIDRFGIGFHIGTNPNGETRKWYDNVVAAHAYIGPLGDGSGGGESSGSGEGSGGGSDSDDPSESGGPSEGGSDTSGSEASSGAPPSSSGAGTEGSGDAMGDDADGCGCTTTRNGSWLAFVLVVLLRRRR
jgi:MYXO-CTERM domain-containing protein